MGREYPSLAIYSHPALSKHTVASAPCSCQIGPRPALSAAYRKPTWCVEGAAVGTILSRHMYCKHLSSQFHPHLAFVQLHASNSLSLTSPHRQRPTLFFLAMPPSLLMINIQLCERRVLVKQAHVERRQLIILNPSIAEVAWLAQVTSMSAM